MKRILLFAIGLCAVNMANAQWSVTTLGATTDTITFDQTFSGVNNGVFKGDGFDSSPASGLLDSDAWEVTGMSDGSTTYGGTFTSGDFARGDAAGGVSSGGVYAFEVLSGDTALGIQPGGSDWTPGDLTLRVINNTGSDADTVKISYDLFINNDQGRGNYFNLSYAINSSSFIDVVALNDTSVEASQGSVMWVSSNKSATINVTVADGDTLLLRWTGDDVTGGGSRDEFAIDNIGVGLYANTTPPPPSVPTYPISLINNVDVNGVADSMGTYCFVKGVVGGMDLDGNAGLQFFLWDQEGIQVFNFNDVDGYVVTEGDSILVRGTIGQFNGQCQIQPDSIALLNSGNTVPNAVLTTSLSESDESQRRRIENFWVNIIDGSNYELVNGNDTVIMRVDSDVDANSVDFAVGDTICYVEGWVGQFDNSSPYTSGYQLFPMFVTDVDNNCGSLPPFVVPIYPIEIIETVDVDGELDSAGVYCGIRGIVAGVDLQGVNSSNNAFTVIDSTGGFGVFAGGGFTPPYLVTEGDSVIVWGTIGDFNGLGQISADSMHFISGGHTLPAHVSIDMLNESTESELIQLDFVQLADLAQWSPGGSGFNVDVVNCAGDTFDVRIDSDTDVDSIYPTAPTTDLMHLKGIGGQFDNSSPHTEGYQFYLHRASDIEIVAPAPPAPTLVINELQSDNQATIMDEDGDYDDWVELYNTGSTAVPLGGLYFTDDASDLTQYQVPMSFMGTVAAGGYELIWCDNDGEDLHTNFALSNDGDFFAVSYRDGCEIIVVDSISFGPLAFDQSFGREEDGADNFIIFGVATPNAMNEILAVDENGVETGLKAWPNPANRTLHFSENVSFTVFNLTGQAITSQVNARSLDVSEFENGLYLIQTTNGELIRVIVE